MNRLAACMRKWVRSLHCTPVWPAVAGKNSGTSRLRFECLEPRLALSVTTTLDWDGPDEPFYTTPGVGATLSLSQVNARLAAASIPLSVHSANEPTWALSDCCGGNHFLLGNQADGAGGSDGPADFYGNFLDGVATRVALDVGFFVNSASARLTAYAETITSGSAAELASLTEVGSQTLSIDGSSQSFFNFDLTLAQPGRSFVLEVFGNSTGPAVNQIEWDSPLTAGATTFDFDNDLTEYPLGALVPGDVSLHELNLAYGPGHGFHDEQFLFGAPAGSELTVVADGQDYLLRFSPEGTAAVNWWLNSRAGSVFPSGTTLSVEGFETTLASGHVTMRAFEERIGDGSFAELAGLTTVAEVTLPLSNGTADAQLELPADARSFTLHLSDAAGSFISAPANVIGGFTIDTADDPNPPPASAMLPTEVGQWHQFRGDQRLTGRATLPGNVTDPEVLWTQFIGARRTALALSNNGADPVSFDLPADSSSMSQAEQLAWGIGTPRYDLDGTGVLTAIAPSIYEKIGDFLPASPGLERVTISFESGSLDGRVRLYTRNGSGGWHQEWVSAVIPSVEFGPNILVDDIDNDGQLEIALTPWYNTYVLDLASGAIEGTASFNPPGSESGRPYGWFGAHDLNGDDRKELIVLGDFENKIGVVGWNNGQLQTLWTRLIEPGVEMKQTVFHPRVNPVADINGDGLPEIVVSIYNEAGDQRWHVLALDGMTGSTLLDLPDHYLQGSADVDVDGNLEMFVTASPQGPAPSTSGEIKILDFDGSTLVTRWESSGAGFQTGLIQNFPLHVNSGAGTGRETLLVGAIESGNDLPVFFTRQVIDDVSRQIEIAAWRFDGAGQFVNLATVTGPNLEVIATQAGTASSPQILATVEILGDAPGQSILLDGFSAEVAESQLIGPGQTSAVVGRLNEGDAPTVIVGGSTEQLVAFDVNTWTGQTAIQWTSPGRGEYAGSSNFQGQHGIGNVVLADLLGDGRLATLAATRSDEGHARIVALSPEGNALWQRDFPFPGAPPEWNVGGLTTFKAGHFRSVHRQDVIVSLRQSTMHSDVYFLLDGETGDIVWTRDWGNTPGVGSHDRGAGGSQLAVYDWDGDGLDEAVNIYPDVFYVLDGTGSNVRDRNLVNGAAYPGIWPQGGIPIVEDFLGNGSATVFHSGSLNVVGLLDDQGDPIWHLPGSYSQFSPAVLDFDGDGSFELFLDEVAYSADDGAVLFSRSLPGTPGPAVSADIDGDGRDEAILTSGSRLYVVGYNPSTGTGSVEWSMTFDSTVGMPIVADANGDNQLEIIVVSSSGTVYGVGQPAAVIPGDYNRDGRVDVADYTVWRDTLGSMSDLRADGNGNQMVDQNDHTVWKENFGATAAASVSSHSSTLLAQSPGPTAPAAGTPLEPVPDSPTISVASDQELLADSTGIISAASLGMVSGPNSHLSSVPARQPTTGSPATVALSARDEALSHYRLMDAVAAASASQPFDVTRTSDHFAERDEQNSPKERRWFDVAEFGNGLIDADWLIEVARGVVSRQA